jgi:hypothetical protein
MDRMKWKIKNHQTRLYLITAVILLIGLGSAVFLYQTAENDSDSVLGYEIVNGQAYPIRPEDSKMYRHDLELYGGKYNVIADEFTRWFAGLWHGKSLAFTVACITVFLSVGFMVVANSFRSDLNSDARDEDKGIESQ